MEKEFNGKNLIAAIKEWKYASESRKVFAMLADEDDNVVVMGLGKGKDLIISLASALTHEERAFSICKAALNLATFAKNAEANAKEHVEE